MIVLHAELPDKQALALAQFLKRAGLDVYRQCAADEQEAYAMQEAGDTLRRALAEQGYAPR